MPSNWNKGLTKETNPSLLKTSQTMKFRGLDNFSKWRNKMKKLGKIKSNYPAFKKDGDLAELIGVILGDGHIETFPRTECLYLLSNSNNPGFVKRYSKFIEKIFNKKPSVAKLSYANCIRIRLYEKNISKRLSIPSGNRGSLNITIPRWILRNKKYVVRYLRGLYEAEGSFCIHKPTYTYKLFFSNKNKSLLDNVYNSLKSLGFHPHLSKDQVQISKKIEVYECKYLVRFRQY
jgi:DNA-binding transcriptional regulator WhiA